MMKVELINTPTLEFIDSGIGKCYNKGSYYPDIAKGNGRIDRICNKMKHASMLRFVHYIFDVECSTSVLLEMSRHQVGVDNAWKSTRYTIRDLQIDYEPSNSDKVNNLLGKQRKELIELIRDNPELKPDDIKLLLPQAFIYKGQIQFNAQSLQHFLKLRTAKASHYHIREFATELYNNIPEDHKFLFDDVVTKV
jgi:thymidylate synthase (FAD)